jgi:hypothetical protein
MTSTFVYPTRSWGHWLSSWGRLRSISDCPFHFPFAHRYFYPRWSWYCQFSTSAVPLQSFVKTLFPVWPFPFQKQAADPVLLLKYQGPTPYRVTLWLQPVLTLSTSSRFQRRSRIQSFADSKRIATDQPLNRHDRHLISAVPGHRRILQLTYFKVMGV